MTVFKVLTRTSKKVAHYVALFLSCGDFDIRDEDGQPLILVKSLLRQALYPSQAITVFRAIRLMGFTLDDRIDAISPSELIQKGDATLGIKRSQFINNPEVILDEEWKKILNPL